MSKKQNKFEGRRAQTLNEMTAATKRLAVDFERRFSAEHHESLVLRHDTGVAIDVAVIGEAEYGSNVLEQLAGYLGVSADWLYKLRTYSRVYAREEVERLAERRMGSGGRLRFHHLAVVMVVKSVQERTRLVERALEESLSVRALRAIISAGDGAARTERPMRRPKTVLEGLTQVIDRSQSLKKRFSKWKPEVFDLLEHSGSDELSKLVANRAAFAKDVLDELKGELSLAAEAIGNYLAASPACPAAA